MTRFDLLSPRKDRNDQTRWHKVGAAFPRDKGGFSLVFDSLPLPDNEGRVSLLMLEAKPREERSSTAETAHRAQAPAGRDLDDEVPF